MDGVVIWQSFYACMSLLGVIAYYLPIDYMILIGLMDCLECFSSLRYSICIASWYFLTKFFTHNAYLMSWFKGSYSRWRVMANCWCKSSKHLVCMQKALRMMNCVQRPLSTYKLLTMEQSISPKWFHFMVLMFILFWLKHHYFILIIFVWLNEVDGKSFRVELVREL